MAKLVFKYGPTGANKTDIMLMTRQEYIKNGLKTVLLTPEQKSKEGNKIIKSSFGLEAEYEYVEEFIPGFCLNPCELDMIFIDDAQFLSPKQVDELSLFVDIYNIPVVCYGLKTDFQSKLFAGSKRLLEIADNIEELQTICWCGNKAVLNARIFNGEVVYEGEQIIKEKNEKYIPLCRTHYKEGKIKKILKTH